jgi:glutaredoxin
MPKMQRLSVSSTRNLEGASPMSATRKIEIFSAGCPACTSAIELVNRIACESCEVSVLDMGDSEVAARAERLGIRSVPAIVIDGDLADCCAGRGVDEASLRAAGLGQPLS